MAKSTKAASKKPVEKDLHATLAQLRKDLGDARRSLAANELPNPQVVKNTRREIARTLTDINAVAKTKKEAKNA